MLLTDPFLAGCLSNSLFSLVFLHFLRNCRINAKYLCCTSGTLFIEIITYVVLKELRIYCGMVFWALHYSNGRSGCYTGVIHRHPYFHTLLNTLRTKNSSTIKKLCTPFWRTDFIKIWPIKLKTQYVHIFYFSKSWVMKHSTHTSFFHFVKQQCYIYFYFLRNKAC